jgi:hypothetical protein
MADKLDRTDDLLDREIAEAKAREEQREREEKEPTPAGKRAMDNGTALNSGKAD